MQGWQCLWYATGLHIQGISVSDTCGPVRRLVQGVGEHVRTLQRNVWLWQEAQAQGRSSRGESYATAELQSLWRERLRAGQQRSAELSAHRCPQAQDALAGALAARVRRDPTSLLAGYDLPRAERVCLACSYVYAGPQCFGAGVLVMSVDCATGFWDEVSFAMP